MKHAKDFLSKFSNLTPPHDAIRAAVAKAVRAVAGVPVKKHDVSVKRGVAFIECSSVAKHAIRVQRGEILRELFSALPSAREQVRDVR